MSTRADGAERELTRLREMFQQAPGAMALLRGPEHIFEMANPAYLQLVGHREVVGKPVSEALPEVVGQGFIELLDRVYRSGEAHVGRTVPVALQRTRGGVLEDRVVDFVYQPLRDATGRVTGIFVDAADVTERVRAEEALRASQEMIALAMRGGRMGAWACDLPDGRVGWTSDPEGIFGAPAGSLGGSGLAFLELVHPDERQELLEKVERAIAGRADYAIEFRFRHATGEWRWIEARGRPAYDASDRPQHLYGIAIDITDRKRAEEQLRAQSATMETIITYAAEAIFLMDAGGAITYANPAAEETFGWTVHELRGKKLHDVIHYKRPDGSDFPIEECAVVACYRTGQTIRNHEDVFVRRGGSFVPVLCSMSPIRHDGAITGAVLTVTDISERKQAEEQLRRTGRRLSRIFETNLLGVAYFDLAGGVQDANDEFLRIVGHGREDLRSGLVDWARMTAPEDKQQDARALAELRRSGAHAPIEKRYVRKDGSRAWVLVGSAMLEGDSGVCFVLDISGLKSAEEALREADRRKDEFLATLAHELRNPLAPVRSALHVLKAGAGEGESRIAREIIERQVRHMVRLVDDLLEVSRITHGHIGLQHEPLRLDQVLADALDAVRPIIQDAGHALTVHLPAAPLLVEGDATRLIQVFQNLLDNACKYTPRGGRITVRAERIGSECAVSVSDTGVGIPEEMHSRIFELFTRSHPADRIKVSGLGIGLALSKQLVELHGGRLEVVSPGEGQGSEFRVLLPIREAVTSPAQPGASDRLPTAGVRGRRILVADDNHDAATSLAMVLQRIGCAVKTVFDGPEALAELEKFRPDAVLLDIGMPGMDGYEVARRIRRRPDGRELLLVALTGWGQDEDRRRAFEAGFDEHLTKPADPALLETLLSAGHARAARSELDPQARAERSPRQGHDVLERN